MCRQDVRKVVYKKKVIEPDFLKLFDEEKIVLSEEIQINPSRYMSSTYRLPHYSWVMPSMHNFSYLQPIAFFPFQYSLPAL
jgi:hypothetical protein